MATSGPTAQPTGVSDSPTLPPPATATVIPTNTVQAASVTVDPSCRTLEPPLIYIPSNSTHQFIDPLNEQECHVTFQNVDFNFGILWGEDGFYGTLIQDSGALNLVQITFDGEIQTLLPIPPGYYQSKIVLSADGQRLAWSNNGGIGEQFLTELWTANIDGSEARKLFEIAVSPDDIYGQIIDPIGLDENNDVLFSIEPNGRGGGWSYVGIYSNLNRVSLQSGVSEELFTCDEMTGPFCINSFSPSFERFSYASFQAKIVNIVALESAELIHSLTLSERDFAGLPVFNAQGDLALMSVDVVDQGSWLKPENGYIGIVNADFNASLEWLPAESISYLIGWLDNDHLLYTSLANDQNSSFVVINRDGMVVREFAMPTAFYRVVMDNP